VAEESVEEMDVELAAFPVTSAGTFFTGPLCLATKAFFA